MINREELRRQKQEECDQRIEQLHQTLPRLGEIAQAIGLLSMQRIRVGILQKNTQVAKQIDQKVSALIQEKRLILSQNGLTMAVYQPQWQCVKCEDRGYTKPGELCTCYLQERLDDGFKQSGIPEAMRAYQFANFDVSYYTDPQNMANKLQRCQLFVRQLKLGEQRQNLLFLGEVGRGKTHLSIAIANEALANGNTVIYKRIDDLLDIIRQYKFEREQDQPNDRFQLEQLKTCDLLVIDDLGAETVTSFVINQIRIVIEERNMRNKPWIINSNLSLNDIQTVYGQRVMDRIMEKTAIFNFDAPQSIRLLKRMNQDGVQ